MRVAFVIQRYGLEVNGGSEYLCRLVAERMAKYWDLEVLTSCALDYTTWDNHYEPGLSTLNGVRVRRFQVDFPRSLALFNRLTGPVFNSETTKELQFQWAREQGPYSSEFLRYLNENSERFTVFFFFTYLYGFTFFGLSKVAKKSILIPTAHDEPPFHLPIYEQVFEQAKGWLFCTEEERDLVLGKFKLSKPNQVVGVGIDLPLKKSQSRPEGIQDHQLDKQSTYCLYVGRVDESKGCKAMFEHFLEFKKRNPLNPVQLLLVGKAVMEVPQDPSIVHLGFVSEETKNDLMGNAACLIMPSQYESLSLVILESWSFEVPVLVNGKCAVLKGQVDRSEGGLTYTNVDEFENGLKKLLDSPENRHEMGQKGFYYIKGRYLWNAVEETYLNWARKVSLTQGVD